MHPAALIAVSVIEDRQARLRREADAWRRLHAKPDCGPLPTGSAGPARVPRLPALILAIRDRRLSIRRSA